MLDTADIYGMGANEALIARFLCEAPGRRQRVVVASKGGIVRGATPAEQRRDSSPAFIPQACEASLERLEVERIDLYYLHRLDEATPVEDSLGELLRLRDEGKIAAAGLSEVTVDELRRAATVMPVSAVQSEYSPMTRGAEVEAVIDACADVGAAVVAFSPLIRGLLSGTHAGATALPRHDLRSRFLRFQEQALIANLSLADSFAEAAAALGLTPAQGALAWVLARGPHVMAIPGTRSLERLAENMGALAAKLTPAQRKSLTDVVPADAVVGGRYPGGG